MIAEPQSVLYNFTQFPLPKNLINCFISSNARSWTVVRVDNL